VTGGKAFPVIDVIDLTHVTGGVDKQTSAAQAAIAQAIAAIQDVASAVAPKDTGMLPALMAMMNHRRPGPGPTPAPALPPTSTLTR
jgi:ribosomal protein S9